MPRQARLDIPGLLQHVIVRGIERRNIFRDNTDRKAFCERLSRLLLETETDCFAWALIPNHFHLLIRTNRIELKEFMRRLLTGYAVTFNRRHRRAGHVFQNRYKSIVCEEETYLLELIRYIHLNPLRAKIVPSLDSLNTYQWSGHSVLMGTKTFEGQSTDEVLRRFGNLEDIARNEYFKFVVDGVSQGRRDELVGGGLQRSTTGLLKPVDEPESYDARVLGCGSFVDQLHQENELREVLSSGMTLVELFQRVEQYFGVESGKLAFRSNNSNHIKARDTFCFIAVRKLLYPGTEVGKILNIQRSAVSHAVRRGQLITTKDADMIDKILNRQTA
ncbi:MAG: transposase [Proteobacteria bacterium]|nr:transposase [Pseudomonadota bacterium]MBU1687443.1 transposase [Pseudomonadota bacterium]